MSASNPVIVGRHAIGSGRPCWIVAEAGVNHDGDLDTAKRLVEAAAAAGADAVKFQTWRTDDLVAPGAPLADYQREAGGAPDQRALLEALELHAEEFRALKAHADDIGITFFSAADDEGSADLLEALGVPAFKIGSGELTNVPLLAHVARKGRPVVLSTGMADLAEVETAVATLEEGGCTSIVLLHCVSLYPTPPEQANVRAIDALAAAFGYPVGFSDHTLGREVALAAVARGAAVLEKHITLDTASPGPDHAVSLDPQAFRAFVDAVRTVERSLGDGRKRPVPEEAQMRRVARRAVVTARPLRAGHTIQADDLVLRRAGVGLPASALTLLVGRNLRVDVGAETPMTLAMVE